MSTITSIIGTGFTVEGDVSFGEGLHIAGTVIGDVCAADGATALLTVGPGGRIEGDVTAGDVTVEGMVIGNLYAAGTLRLAATATVLGDVGYRLLTIAAGAVVEGLLHKVD